MIRLSTRACPVVIFPDGIGLSIVRFINLSRSFSMISLNPFAAPVTRKPPTVNITQLTQFISPCNLLPIKKQIEAEKTTVRVSLSLINLLKSDIKFLTIFSVSLFHITLPACSKCDSYEQIQKTASMVILTT